MICAHGARGGSAAAAAHAAAIAGHGLFAAVRACSLFGTPSLEEIVVETSGRPTLVLPFLMADGYTARTVLPRRLGAADVRVLPPLGADPRLAEVIAHAACDAGAGPESAVLIVGHGSRRDPRSGATAEAHAGRLAGAFARVGVAFLDQRPSIAEAVAALGERPLVAVGLFADAGAHGEDDVPRLLAEARPGATYAGPIGPRPAIAEIMLAHAVEVSWPKRAQTTKLGAEQR